MTADAGPAEGGRFQQMQAFEDAICWRTGRLAEVCPACDASAEVFCDDHATDLQLITGYRLAVQRLAQAGES